MSQRIEPVFFKYDAKNWTLFLWIWRKELKPFFFEYDAKNWTPFSLNMTQRIGPLILWMWRKELNPFSLNMTWRIELFFQYAFFSWIFEFLFLKKNDSKNWTFLKNTTQRTEVLFQYDSKIFFQDDSQNWTFFPWLKEMNLKNLTLKKKNWPFFFGWLTDLNLLFLEYDSKNWTFFFWRPQVFFEKKNDSKNWSFFF